MAAELPGALGPYGCSERVLTLFAGVGDPDAQLVRVVRVERSRCVAVFADGTPRRVGGPERPAVGDWGVVTGSTDLALLPRWSALTRLDPDGTNVQVLAANVDVVILTAPVDRLSPQRVERELAIAWDSGAVPVVVLTKVDMAEAGVESALRERLDGVEVLGVSSLDGRGLDALASLLRPARTAVLLGPSGAGKSTLANLLLGAQVMETGSVRDGDSRGRHTTTSRYLVPVPGGGVIIDTPGLRSLGLAEDVDVSAAFPDIERLAEKCRFSDCTHETEPGCAVTAAVARGELDPSRFASFRKLRREIRAGESTSDPAVRRAQVAQSKARNKAGRLAKRRPS